MKKKKFQEQIIVKKAINDGLTIIWRILLDEPSKERKNNVHETKDSISKHKYSFL